MCFASANDVNAFAHHLAICKAALSGFQRLVNLDVVASPKGKAVVRGDTLVVRYSSYVVDETKANPQVGQQFESNRSEAEGLKFRVGDSRFSRGIEEGVIGMRKGSRRMIVVPSELAHTKNMPSTVPANARILFDVEVVKKLKRSEEPLPPSVPQPTMPVESPVKSSPLSGLINKGAIAVMLPHDGFPGAQQHSQQPPQAAYQPSQIMHPSQPQTIQQTSLPLQQSHQQMPQQLSQQHPQQHAQQHPQQLSQQSGLSSPLSASASNPSLNSHSMMHQPISNSTPYNQMPVDNSASHPYNWAPQMGYHHNMPPSINQQNMELQSSISNLSLKVTEVYNKLDSSVLFRASKSDDYVSGVALLQSIQKIVDDNDKLKLELAQKTEVIDELRNKIQKLHQKNEKFIEENNKAMEQRNEDMKLSGEQTRRRIKELMDDKVNLERELNETSLARAESDRKQATLSRELVIVKTLSDSQADQIQFLTRDIEQQKQMGAQRAAALQLAVDQEKAQLKESHILAEQFKMQLEQSKHDLASSKSQAQVKENSLQAKIQEVEQQRDALELAKEQLSTALNKQRLAEGIKQDQIKAIEEETNNKYKAIIAQKDSQLSSQVSQIETLQQSLTDVNNQHKLQLDQVQRQSELAVQAAQASPREDPDAQAKISQLQSELQQVKEDAATQKTESIKKVILSVCSLLGHEQGLLLARFTIQTRQGILWRRCLGRYDEDHQGDDSETHPKS